MAECLLNGLLAAAPGPPPPSRGGPEIPVFQFRFLKNNLMKMRTRYSRFSQCAETLLLRNFIFCASQLIVDISRKETKIQKTADRLT